MWPYGSTNPMTAKFQAAKEQAANLTQLGERGAYTEDPEFRDPHHSLE